MRTLIAAAVLLPLAFAAAADTVPEATGAGAAPARSLDGINACMRANTPRAGAVQDVTLDSVDHEGINKVIKLRALRKTLADGKVRLQMRVVDPPIMAGSSYLVIEQPPHDDIYLYLALLKALTHIKPGQMTAPLWGTGISYVELKQAQGVLEGGTAELKADGVVAGRPVWVIDTRTDIDTSGYRRVVSYVDQESCMLLKADFIKSGDEPYKTLETDASTLTKAGGTWRVGKVTVRTPKERSHTHVLFGAAVAHNDLPDALFEPASFHLTPLP